MARQAKAAEKEAELIIASLSRASDAAVGTTLTSVAEKLRQNFPLMYHINALLNNEEWTAVLASSIGGQGAQEVSGDKPDSAKKAWRLRAGVKKFAHLERRDSNHISHRWQTYSVIDPSMGLGLIHWIGWDSLGSFGVGWD